MTRLKNHFASLESAADSPIDKAHVRKGAFHEWLGKSKDEPITDADIERGLASDDPRVRKMAQFAKNARKWKHPKVSTESALVMNYAANYMRGRFDVEQNRGLTEGMESINEGLSKIQATLESYRDTGISRDSYRLVHLALEAHLGRMGLPVPQFSTVSAESHTTGTFTLSTEALSDILGAVQDHGEAMVTRLKQSLLSALGELSGSIPVLARRWAGLNHRSRYAVATETTGVVPTAGWFMQLQMHGTATLNRGYLEEFSDLVGEIVAHFSTHGQSAIATNAHLMASLDFSTTGAFYESYQHAMRGWADPRVGLPANAFEFVIPGRSYMFSDDALQYNGEDPAIRFFDRYGALHQPSDKSALHERQAHRAHANEITSVQAMGLEDIIQISGSYGRVTSEINLSALTRTDSLAHIAVDIAQYKSRRAAASVEVRKECRLALKAMDRAYRTCFELGEYFTFHLLHDYVRVSNALLVYMTRSLKTIVILEPTNAE